MWLNKITNDGVKGMGNSFGLFKSLCQKGCWKLTTKSKSLGYTSSHRSDQQLQKAARRIIKPRILPGTLERLYSKDVVVGIAEEWAQVNQMISLGSVPFLCSIANQKLKQQKKTSELYLYSAHMAWWWYNLRFYWETGVVLDHPIQQKVSSLQGRSKISEKSAA